MLPQPIEPTGFGLRPPGQSAGSIQAAGKSVSGETSSGDRLAQGYSDLYEKVDLQRVFPSEFVVRIYKGRYPRLHLPANVQGQKICDIGCGDGRNLLVLADVGFSLYATEITDRIVHHVRRGLEQRGIQADVRRGSSSRIPFPDGFFDHLLSWNSAYYMGTLGQSTRFEACVQEFARVLKPGGWLVISVPMASNFVFAGSEPVEPGYAVIRKDPYGIRNGEVFRRFASAEDLADSFRPHFAQFSHARIEDDCFGQANHWHVMVARRTGPRGEGTKELIP